jgi:uroporphyrinogen-III synthase
MRVILTRPATQGEGLAAQLRARGIEVVTLPLIEIVPVADTRGLDLAWAELPACTLVMFVSANAVQHFFAARPPGLTWPERTLAGASGPGTSAALRAVGVPAACLREPGPAGPFDTETLWRQCLSACNWAGTRVQVVRGQTGRDWLATQLRSAGAQVDFVVAYQRRLPPLDAARAAWLDAALRDPQGHCWHFGSAETITNLRALCPQANWATAWALATHPRIAACARAAGFGRVDEIGWCAHDVVSALSRRAQ